MLQVLETIILSNDLKPFHSRVEMRQRSKRDATAKSLQAAATGKYEYTVLLILSPLTTCAGASCFFYQSKKKMPNKWKKQGKCVTLVVLAVFDVPVRANQR